MNAMITTTGTEFKIQLIPEAEKLKQQAIAESKRILKVADDFAQQGAVDAMKSLKDVAKKMEKSRKDAKAPALEFGKQIDEMARRFCADLDAECNRIEALIIPYESEKRRLAAEAEAKRQEELRKQREEHARIEAEHRKKLQEQEAALAKAKNEKARKELEEKIAAQKAEDEKRHLANLQAMRDAPKPVAVEKVSGQVARERWTFEVEDIHALYKHDPSLVRLEPHTSAINIRIAGGQQIPGLRVFQDLKIGVR